MAVLVEVGTACAQAIADAVRARLTAQGLDEPDILDHFTGLGIPIADACEGMVWVRVGSVYPTDGSGAQFTAARPGWHVPAWCFPIEVGVLWCHQNINEDGTFIDASQEAVYAQRDGDYRLAIMTAIYEHWRPTLPDPLAQAVMGQQLLPWTPIGPDGGYSGGMIVTNVIANALAICE